MSLPAAMRAALQEGNVTLPAFDRGNWLILIGVLAASLVALGYGYYLVRKVLRQPAGSERMQEISADIEAGAMTYLWRQFRTMIWFVVAVTAVLWLANRSVYATTAGTSRLPIPVGIALAFIMGVLASYGAGYVGMWLAVKANVRTAHAALTSYGRALELGFRAGAVSGMFTVGFGLLGATIIFLLFAENAMKVLVGFGFG
ncbi:MAG: sodium/proton-translocating pyrophosphatase, partial [Acidimicrobiia bacterium]